MGLGWRRRAARRHRTSVTAQATVIACVVACLVLLTGCGWLLDLFTPPDNGSRPVTESEQRAILEIQTTGGRLYDQLLSEDTPDAAAVTADWLRGLPEVRGVEVGGDGVIWIDYKSGVVGALHPASSTALRVGTSGSFGEGGIQARPLATSSSTTYRQSNAPLRRTAAFYIFPEFAGTYRAIYDRVAGQVLESLGYSVRWFTGSEFTVESVSQMGEYGVICFLTHGSARELTRTTWFLTGEEAQLRHVAWGWIRRGIGVGRTCGGGIYFMFNQRFVQDLSFPNSLVLAHVCSSYKLPEMADAFIGGGAASYLGWTDVTSDWFTGKVTTALFAALSRPGVTVSQAYTSPETRLEGWSQSYSIDELYPVWWWLCNENESGWCFSNGICDGDLASCTARRMRQPPTTTDFVLAGRGDLVLNTGTRVFAASQYRLFLIGVQRADDGFVGHFRTAEGQAVEITDIAWDSERQNLWGISFNQLYRIDPRTAQVTPIGSGLGNDRMNALAVNALGSLFAAGLDGVLMSVCTMTGRASSVGPYGSNYKATGDLVFLPDGRLVGTALGPGDPSDLLVVVNSTTGTATQIGPVGYSDVFGLFVSGGVLYGVTDGGDLISINTTTGRGSFVRKISFGAWGAQSIDKEEGR